MTHRQTNTVIELGARLFKPVTHAAQAKRATPPLSRQVEHPAHTVFNERARGDLHAGCVDEGAGLRGNHGRFINQRHPHIQIQQSARLVLVLREWA